MIIQSENKQYICATRMSYGEHKNSGVFALLAAVNEIMAQGAEIISAEAYIVVPAGYSKNKINEMKKNLEKTAKMIHLKTFEARGEQGPEAALPIVTVTASGVLTAVAASSAKAEQEIVFTGYAGLEGMLRIVAEKEEKLKKRFAKTFLQQMKAYDTLIFAQKEINIAKAMGVSVIRQLPSGGILAGLWNLALETGCGISVDLKKISIKQETIEVCEEFRLNPYQLTSCGCMLMITDHGDELADALNDNGCKASVIGKLTDSNDKIIHNGEEIRYIDRPALDELKKIFK